MATLKWLKQAFDYGYDSGEILVGKPNFFREREEAYIGGSYLELFEKGIKPYVNKDSVVLELGPGKGSWTRAILSLISKGKLHVIDFQDVGPWLNSDTYHGLLVCHKVDDNEFHCLQAQFFDFFWSFGVLCHNTQGQIFRILKNTKSKMKPGGIAVHQYGNWDKLEMFGWEKGGIPDSFKREPDETIWWPRNTTERMAEVAEQAGWEVVCEDLDIFERDSVIVLRAKG